MTREVFEGLRAGDLVGWSVAGYTRVFDVLGAPQKTKKGLVIRVRCRIYGEHELEFKDARNWTKR